MLNRICLTLLLLLYPLFSMADAPAPVRVGEILPEAVLQGLNARSRKLSDYRGTRLIINVWASWCGPCRAEMGSLERLAAGADPTEFRVIGISTDDYPDRAKALLAQIDSRIPQFIDYRLRLETMLGAARLPLTVLVDADGRVMEKVYGARAWDSDAARAFIAETFGD
jgi:thiol-disulfide isomerase/thioredoxin